MISKLLVALLLIGAFLGIRLWQARASLATFKVDHISLRYPKAYVQQPVQAAERHAQNLLSLSRDQPLSTIQLNQETGAIIGANVTKTPFLDFLERNAQRNFKLTYPDYNQLELKRLKVDGKDAALMRFSYTGTDKQTKLYVAFYIIPAGNDAFYLYVQSIDEGRQKKDAKTIQRSVKLF